MPTLPPVNVAALPVPVLATAKDVPAPALLTVSDDAAEFQSQVCALLPLLIVFAPVAAVMLDIGRAEALTPVKPEPLPVITPLRSTLNLVVPPT